MPARTALLMPPTTEVERRDVVRIWGDDVPLRNPDFVGRETLLLQLHRALEHRAKASVLPQALHGMGGVGKTQLALEYAYRYADRYEVVWWIPAEHRSLVLQSLAELGRKLGVPETANLQHAANLVREELQRAPGRVEPLRWLLIYDNASDPDDVASLVPSSGGHVILTSRNQAWSEVWDPIQVDVFDRRESIELVRRRAGSISVEDADRLARTLIDLPLALDQAASLQAATNMAAAEYLELFDRHFGELPPGEPAPYRTISALVRLALHRLRTDAPAVAELLEMFAFLGAEPISAGLLRRGREARLSASLSRALRDTTSLDRALRDLKRFGLAKVDLERRVQVHRLFQAVLRDELGDERAAQALANVHHLLASANPSYPDDKSTWEEHAELGPHISSAGLVDSDYTGARQAVLDQVRYLYVITDFEGCRRLGEAAVAAWSKIEGASDVGPDGELTHIATRHLSNALRSLGFNERARNLIEDSFERLKRGPEFGPDNEHTLWAGIVVAVSLRVAGLFGEALELDRDTLERARRVLGDEDSFTLRVRNNLAVDLRMLSEFERAHEIDTGVVRIWQDTVSENDHRLLFVQTNLARDLYGLGRYAEALALLERILPPYRDQLGAEHGNVLLASRTLAIALRKTGQYPEALTCARRHWQNSESRYGPEHEHSLSAAMTCANSLRVNGELGEARGLASETLGRYQRVFGEDHPLSLAAAVNYAIILRGQGELGRARELDERTYAAMVEKLGSGHAYTLCARSSLANDLAVAGDLSGARRLSEELLADSRQARGPEHPYTLACASNAALDLIAAGETARGRELLDETRRAFAAVLGSDHPETVAAREGRRAECDIEPPPT